MARNHPADRWGAIGDLFARAAELPASEREALLDEACRDDARLRGELASLLAADASAPPGFLGAPGATAVGAFPDVVGVAPSAAADLSSRRVGRYRLVREIARGGMGVVWEAEDVGLGRRVALKTILGGTFASADDARRFRVEAEAAALLDHPNIVSVFEVGEQDGCPFYTMQLVEGRPLSQAMEELGGQPRRAAELVLKLARAVAHGHQRAVIHRDLKPANVLIGQDGEPRIIDFGLARRIDTDNPLTRTGVIAGTPAYMAPEQARGDARAIRTGVDVWALGAILYELLAGRAPFGGGSDVDVLARVAQGDVAPPSRHAPGLPRDLETICLKCLRADATERYDSAEALARDLEAYLRGDPIAARAPTLRYLLGLAARRHRRRLIAAAVLACAVLALALAFVLAQRRALLREQALRAEGQALLLAAAGRDAMEDGRNLLGLRLAREAVLLSRRPETEQALRDVLGARGFEAFRLEGHSNPVLTVAVSPDGALFLSGGHDQTARLWDRQGRTLAVYPHDDAVMHVAFHPRGDGLLTLSRDGSVRTWDLQGRALGILSQPGDPATGALHAPDGSAVLTHGGHVARLWSVAGDPLAVLVGHAGPVRAAAFSPDSGRIVTASEDGTARLWDRTGRPLLTLPHGSPVRACAFAWGGAAVLTGTAGGAARVFSLQGVELARSSRPECEITGILPAPDPAVVGLDCRGSQHVVWDARLSSADMGAPAEGSASDDRGTTATSAPGREMRLWVRRLVPMSRLAPTVAGAGAGSRAFTPDGELVLAATWTSVTAWGHLDGGLGPAFRRAHAVDAAMDAAGTKVATLERVVLTWDREGRIAGEMRPATDCRALRFHPAGATLLVSCGSEAVLVDLEGATLVRFPHVGPPRAVSFDARGTRVLTHSSSVSASAWDLTGRRLLELPHVEEGAEGVITAAAFLDDVGLVATAGTDGAVRGWTPSGQAPWRVEVPRGAGASLRLLAASGGVVAWGMPGGAWRIDAGGRLAARYEIPHDQTIVWLDVAAGDGAVLGLQKDDRAIRLWSVDGMELLSLPALAGLPSALRFSPDGQRFAAGLEDGTIRVHDRTGVVLATLSADAGSVSEIAWTRDGRRILSLAGGVARLRCHEADDLLRRTGEILWGDFTPEELDTYGHLLPAGALARARVASAP